MAGQTLTFIDAHAATTIDAVIDDPSSQRVRVTAAALTAATGWSVKPEGFCRDDVCVPAGDAVGADGAVDLAQFARRLGRPFVADLAEHAVSLGAAAGERGAALQSLLAPDFTLPDLTGKLHSLSQYRGSKILLATYASW